MLSLSIILTNQVYADDYTFSILNSTVDATYIYNQNPVHNYGNSSDIIIETNGGTDQTFYALFRFDNIFGSTPGQIPYGSTIDSATLTIRTLPYTTSTSLTFIKAYQVNTAWNEMQVTWNNFGSTPGGQSGIDWNNTVLGQTKTPVAKTAYDINITNDVAQWSNQTAINNGVILINGEDQAVFYSDDRTEFNPYLTISTSSSPVAPEPASIILSLIGGLSLFIKKKFF